jgi:tryptophan synthase beta chain
VQLFGAEGGGEGRRGRTAATLSLGSPGVLHGSYSYLLQDAQGQIAETHSISAGLDYPGVGPEHSYWKDLGRVRYFPVKDKDALQAFQELSRLEGIVPALESAHALALSRKLVRRFPRSALFVINLSGRGDKDLATVEKLL